MDVMEFVTITNPVAIITSCTGLIRMARRGD